MLQEIDTKYPESADRNTKAKHSQIETNDKPVSNEVDATKEYPSNTISFRIKPIPIGDSNQPINDRLEPNNDYLEKPLSEFRKLYTDIRSSSGDRSSSTAAEPTKGIKSPQNSRSPERQSSYESNEQTETPLHLEVLELQVKKEALKKEKEEKIIELEILKDNINKMYNLDAQKSPSGQQTSEKLDIEDIGSNRTNADKSSHSAKANYEVNKMMESLSVDGQESENTSDVQSGAEGGREQISSKITILISPKRSTTNVRCAEKRRSVSPEQAAKLTRNDVLDAIFHTDGLKETSSYDMDTESKDDQETVTDEEQGPPEDYHDDFSADVNDFSAISDDENSPISLAKPIDDENFWDS